MDNLSDQNDEEKKKSHPSPADFDAFLPWACMQLSVETDIIVHRTVLSDYVSTVASDRSKSKGKPKSRPPSPSKSDEDALFDDKSFTISSSLEEPSTFVETVYDSQFHLIQLRFLRNKAIPSKIMKIIGLVIPFHKFLSSIVINSGLQKEALYQISIFLPLSRITEICLDHTFLPEANYHLLLDQSCLKHLSLAKCKINDIVVKTIAVKLNYPSPASKTLSILNLATNKITDLGAQYLATTLRSNRCLCYLNLADNMITDTGAEKILNKLIEFPLTDSEIMDRKLRRVAYLKVKNELVFKSLKNLRNIESEKRVIRRKTTKSIGTSMLSPKRARYGNRDFNGDERSYLSMDTILYEKAKVIAESILGAFDDPFSPSNTVSRDNITYCYGNNNLCYLNLAYNDLTYFSIRKLNEVLQTQNLLGRKPKGLVNVVMEGNSLPEACAEYDEIEYMFEAGLLALRRTSAYIKKARPSRSSK